MKNTIKHYRLHRFLMWLIRILFGSLIKYLMGFQYKREKGPNTPSIIVSNHNTDLDPALLGIGFSSHMYFVASEHAFRKGLFSLFLKLVFGPIPINKVKADAYTLKEIVHRVKSGASICIFAEGNRSYNGVTGDIPLSTAKLVKLSGAALITYRLEGGYFTTPRWAKKKRRGKITGRVVGRYSALELQSMTATEILQTIIYDIHEEAYEKQKVNPIPYRGEDLAEHIELVLYLCPQCKKIGTIHSRGSRFSCDCGLNGVYTETGFLEGERLPFSTITAWDRWQSEQLPNILSYAGDEPICRDDNQKLFKVLPATGTTLVGEGPMQMSSTEFHCARHVFSLQQITRFSIVDKMTLSFMTKDGTQYEVLSAKPRSALKYLEIFNLLCKE